LAHSYREENAVSKKKREKPLGGTRDLTEQGHEVVVVRARQGDLGKLPTLQFLEKGRTDPDNI